MLRQVWANWWVRVLAVWAATRVLTTALFLWAASIQGPSYWNGPKPSYFNFLNIWDVEWYHRIFDYGYGQLPGYSPVLPTDAHGNVQQNSWAFMPLYPALVRLVNLVTGLEWKYASAILSTALSFVLALLVYKVFALKFEAQISLWGLAIFGLSVASPVLQTGYAETLALVWLAAALYFLMQHRYLASAPFLALLSITRPGMIAFAMSLAGMWLVRFVKARRGTLPFERWERWQLASLTVFSGFLGFAWALIAWAGTGRADAYFATELAWRSWLPGSGKLNLVSPWFYEGQFFFGKLGWLVVLAIFAYATWLMFSDSVKRLGNELRLWLAAYFLYLILVFNPQSSTFRILLPAFPLALALAYKTRNWHWLAKTGVVVIEILLMMLWLAICWVYQAPDFTPP